MVRLAAVGNASTGKSALLNVLFGTAFSVDPRAGSTTAVQRARVLFDGTELEVLDCPPLGHAKADAYLLVCDKDLTSAEYEQAVHIARSGRPLVVVLNKADTYTGAQLRQLLDHIEKRLVGLVPPHRIVTAAAHPVRLIDELQPDGSIVERSARAWPLLEEIEPVLREAIEEARNSLRVQTREAAGRVITEWKKLRRS